MAKTDLEIFVEALLAGKDLAVVRAMLPSLENTKGPLMENLQQARAEVASRSEEMNVKSDQLDNQYLKDKQALDDYYLPLIKSLEDRCTELSDRLAAIDRAGYLIAGLIPTEPPAPPQPIALARPVTKDAEVIEPEAYPKDDITFNFVAWRPDGYSPDRLYLPVFLPKVVDPVQHLGRPVKVPAGGVNVNVVVSYLRYGVEANVTNGQLRLECGCVASIGDLVQNVYSMPKKNRATPNVRLGRFCAKHFVVPVTCYRLDGSRVVYRKGIDTNRALTA